MSGGKGGHQGTSHKGRFDKTYLRRNAYICKLIESEVLTGADRQFAYHNRKSPSFEIGEILARATGKVYEVMEKDGYGDAKLKALTLSMGAQAHMELTKAKDDGA